MDDMYDTNSHFQFFKIMCIDSNVWNKIKVYKKNFGILLTSYKNFEIILKNLYKYNV